MDMHINLYIEKIAAEVFWFFIFKYGFKATGYPTEIDDIPKNLWSREILLTVLTDVNNQVQGPHSKELIDKLYYGVAETIVTHNRRKENIIGLLYHEDFALCKDPNFASKNLINKQIFDSDQESDYFMQLEGSYLYQGDLILRTPLPSGILLKSKPVINTIYIPNTSKALGFQKKLILLINEVRPLPDNEDGYNFFVTGVFYIPTTQDYDSIWLKLIPNATAFTDGIRLDLENGNFLQGNIIPKTSISKKNLLTKVASFFK